MKTLKLLFVLITTSVIVSSCNVVVKDLNNPNNYVSLEDVVSSYDLWYIDYNKTTGQGDVPFLSKAFTISFLNGKLYANNNLVGIGATGNGYGIQVGIYDTYNGSLEINHDLDGYFDFDVVQLSNDQIKLVDNFNNVSYYLVGYQKFNFDYNQIFYDNIEYFLQEYNAWAKTYTSSEGEISAFDNENYLQFTPEDLTTFYSSQDEVGTTIDNLLWDYVGSYSVANVQGYDNLKILTLHYDSNDTEEFELTVIDDETISLYNIYSGTTYEFSGLGYIQYLKQSSKKNSVSSTGRKRTKVVRETKIRKHLK
jgi:hypothetical protein